MEMTVNEIRWLERAPRRQLAVTGNRRLKTKLETIYEDAPFHHNNSSRRKRQLGPWKHGAFAYTAVVVSVILSLLFVFKRNRQALAGLIDGLKHVRG